MSAQTVTGSQISNIPTNLRAASWWVSGTQIGTGGNTNVRVRTATAPGNGLTYAFAVDPQGNLDYNRIIATRRADTGVWEPTPYASTIGTAFADSIANSGSILNAFNAGTNQAVGAGLAAAGSPSGPNAIASVLTGGVQGGRFADQLGVRSPGAAPQSGRTGGDADVTGTRNQVRDTINSLSTTALSIIGEPAKAREAAVAGLRYPEEFKLDSGMDYVQFSSKTYGNKNINTTTFTTGDRSSKNAKTEEFVILPIQSSISDANTVGWNEETFNPAQIIGANLAIAGISQGVGGFVGSLQEALKKAGNPALQGSVEKAIIAYFTEQAIGTQVLSKVSGAVFNPNTELLFQGPQLRSFSFTFKLTPRSEIESEIVRQIIGFFKRNMSPQTEKSGLYLKAPKIFQIDYFHKGKKDHPGIGLIKDCALQSCNVDYTPDGSYMSFENGAMVSYNLSLQFMELEPIYAKDYDEEAGKVGNKDAKNHLIGY